jgi:Glu-tRNA(Gln) amidotransferase subunit E-like FAD-binding protein
MGRQQRVKRAAGDPDMMILLVLRPQPGQVYLHCKAAASRVLHAFDMIPERTLGGSFIGNAAYHRPFVGHRCRLCLVLTKNLLISNR